YFVLDALAGCVSETPTSGTYVQVFSNRGAIFIRRLDVTLTAAPVPPPPAVADPPPPGYRVGDGLRLNVGQKQHWTRGEPEPWAQDRFRYLLGFSAFEGTHRRRPLRDWIQNEHDRGGTVPHWLPMVFAAAAPALWWRGRRKRRMRRHAGL